MRYVLKKITSLIITLLLVSLFAFLAFSLIPGDPVTKMLGTEYTEEMAAALRVRLGLDAPILIRYFRWLAGFFTGDLGISYSYGVPVLSLLSDKLPVTMLLSAVSFLMTVVLSVPMGIWLSSKEGGIIDRIASIINQAAMSVPPFFLGIIITLTLGLTLGLFVPGNYVPYFRDFGACIYYLLFPAAAIALPKTAMAVKLFKSSISAEYTRDYVKTAYGRGNSRRRVLWTHVLRNAIIPLVTFLAVVIPDIVAGSIVIEQVFSVPGLGRLLVSSILNRDYPVVLAIVMLVAVLVITVNYIADIIYRRIDPRIRIDMGKLR